ncbi:hypothetical protein HDU76_003431 [Blyttiomyces sp. JEL0837]|nr:hypothetical protein HDU76_003431 [Blyttiomyces sp. JEL0837]
MTINRQRQRILFSRWDTLPPELQNEILQISGPLTKLLNNRLTAIEIATQATQIWNTAIEINWQGDLSILPHHGIPNILNGLGNPDRMGIYHLRDFMNRLKSVLFRGSGNRGEDDMNSYINVMNDLMDTISSHEVTNLFIHIPLRQSWIRNETLKRWIDMDLISVLVLSGCCNHIDIFKYLYQNLVITAVIKHGVKTKVSNIVLFGAARFGCIDVVKFLLEVGCTVEGEEFSSSVIRDSIHITPITGQMELSNYL